MMPEALSIIARALLAEFLAACLLFASYSLARRLTSGGSTAERYCALYLCGCWLLTAGFHALIGVGQFNLAGASALALLAGLLTWRFGASPRDVAQAIGSDWAELRATVARNWRSPLGLAVAPFALFAIVLLARVMVLPLLGWDSLTYHGVKAGLWVQQGALAPYDAPGCWEYYRDCLPGGEIFTAWAMLPFHGDLAAGLPDFAHWLFLGLIFYALAQELGIAPRWALPAVCFLLAMPAQAPPSAAGTSTWP